jgi:hypothetical protein
MFRYLHRRPTAGRKIDKVTPYAEPYGKPQM